MHDVSISRPRWSCCACRCIHPCFEAKSKRPSLHDHHSCILLNKGPVISELLFSSSSSSSFVRLLLTCRSSIQKRNNRRATRKQKNETRQCSRRSRKHRAASEHRGRVFRRDRDGQEEARRREGERRHGKRGAVSRGDGKEEGASGANAELQHVFARGEGERQSKGTAASGRAFEYEGDVGYVVTHGSDPDVEHLTLDD